MTEQKHLGDVSVEERDAFYENGECVPTSCKRALALPRVQWIRRENHARPFRRVIELGCHDGFSTRWLLNSPHLDQLVGVELCKQAFDYAEEFKESKHFPELATYIHGSIFDLDTELTNAGIDRLDDGFDVVVVFELIEHFQPEESRKLLQIAHNLLSRGGRCFLTTPHEDGPFGKSNPDPSHIHFFNETSLAQWIEEETGCQATVQNIQGILHAEWQKSRKPDLKLLKSEDPIRERPRPFSVDDFESIPETQEPEVPCSKLSIEQRLQALEAVAHAPVITYTKESIASMMAGVSAQLDSLSQRVGALQKRVVDLETEVM